MVVSVYCLIDGKTILEHSDPYMLDQHCERTSLRIMSKYMRACLSSTLVLWGVFLSLLFVFLLFLSRIAGELPPELGRLSKLEELLMNSNAFSGE